MARDASDEEVRSSVVTSISVAMVRIVIEPAQTSSATRTAPALALERRIELLLRKVAPPPHRTSVARMLVHVQPSAGTYVPMPDVLR
jgi:hypothetical protein